MLIPKGFAWAVVDEDGKLVWDIIGGSKTMALIFPTKTEAKIMCQDVERVVKVKIEVIGG